MIVVASRTNVYVVDPRTGAAREAEGLAARRPSCLAADAGAAGRAWCGSEDAGVFRSDDGGGTWRPAGLANRHVTALALDAAGRLWVGTEPSAILRSDDGGASWEELEGLRELPSASEWSFPPRPDTHHVRWIAGRPGDPDRAWAAIEAGALITTRDGGRSWEDRVPGGPYDTHELAIHPDAPDVLHSAAGDGYFTSGDAGRTWESPEHGLEVRYLRSVAVDPRDPAVVLVSASSGPRSAYVAGHADGRVYRRAGSGAWERVTAGWPDPPATIAPLLAADPGGESLLAADERGVHRSEDGGRSWRLVAEYPGAPDALRGLVATRRMA